MTERYIKASELEKLARALESKANKYEFEADKRDNEFGKSVNTALANATTRSALEIHRLIATAQPREVDEDAEREAFERTLKRTYPEQVYSYEKTPTTHDYWNEKLDDAWTVWLAAKRHERGEG